MLTDTLIRKAPAKEKAYKLADSGGLHLFVSPAGGKLWRFRYEFQGKEKLLSLGKYPGVSLSDARVSRDRAKDILREGRDPSIAKKQNRLVVAKQITETFEVVARDWHRKQMGRWSPVHADDVMRSLERDVFPGIGNYPVRDVTVHDVLAILGELEGRDAVETARRIRQRISNIFAFAIASAKVETNPALLTAGALPAVVKGRQPAITDLIEARKVLAKVDATPGHVLTKLAIRLLALTAVRPGVIAGLPWAELAPGAETWVIPAARMKLPKHLKTDTRRDHIVPLSRQAREVIECARTLSGAGPYVFPNGRHAHKPMSENAMGYMLNRAGYHQRHVPHGWRSTFSTVMNETFPSDRAVIDLMLAHQPTNEVESAYNRSAYLPRRIELAQLWADLITKGLQPPAALKDLPYR